MANSNTSASRAARARCATAANARKLNAGWQRLNILIPPASAVQLQALAELHGSKRAAIIAALAASVDQQPSLRRH